MSSTPELTTPEPRLQLHADIQSKLQVPEVTSLLSPDNTQPHAWEQDKAYIRREFSPVGPLLFPLTTTEARKNEFVTRTQLIVMAKGFVPNAGEPGSSEMFTFACEVVRDLVMSQRPDIVAWTLRGYYEAQYAKYDDEKLEDGIKDGTIPLPPDYHTRVNFLKQFDVYDAVGSTEPEDQEEPQTPLEPVVEKVVGVIRANEDKIRDVIAPESKAAKEEVIPAVVIPEGKSPAEVLQLLAEAGPLPDSLAQVTQVLQTVMEECNTLKADKLQLITEKGGVVTLTLEQQAQIQELQQQNRATVALLATANADKEQLTRTAEDAIHMRETRPPITLAQYQGLLNDMALLDLQLAAAIQEKEDRPTLDQFAELQQKIDVAQAENLKLTEQDARTATIAQLVSRMSYVSVEKLPEVVEQIDQLSRQLVQLYPEQSKDGLSDILISRILMEGIKRQQLAESITISDIRSLLLSDQSIKEVLEQLKNKKGFIYRAVENLLTGSVTFGSNISRLKALISCIFGPTTDANRQELKEQITIFAVR